MTALCSTAFKALWTVACSNIVGLAHNVIPCTARLDNHGIGALLVEPARKFVVGIEDNSYDPDATLESLIEPLQPVVRADSDVCADGTANQARSPASPVPPSRRQRASAAGGPRPGVRSLAP